MPKYQRGIAAALLRVLSSAPGATFWVDDLMTDLGATRVQVQGSANYLIHNGHPIRVVNKGTAWTYDEKPPAPEAPAEQLMFEQIGTTRIGDLILQDQNSNLYRATALD